MKTGAPMAVATVSIATALSDRSLRRPDAIHDAYPDDSVRRDVLGNTVVSDDRGNKTSCRVDLLGKARCK